MNFFYDPQTDSLFIELAKRAYAESAEVADGLVVDFDADGRPIALDIQQASKVLDQPILAGPPALPFAMLHVTPEVLREVRAALDMTQVDLASKLGVAPNTVARWERGVMAIEKADVGRVLNALMSERPSVNRGRIVKQVRNAREKPLPADRQTKAKTTLKPGYGNRGDQKRKKK